MKSSLSLKKDPNKIEKMNIASDLLNLEYNSFFDNFKEIHTKSSALIAFHGAIIIFFNDTSLCKLTELSNFKGYIFYLSFIKYILLFIIFGLALASIILLIIVMRSGTIQRINISSLNEDFFSYSIHDIKKSKIETYKNILVDNSKILLKKHSIFNASLILTIIEMCFIILYMIFKLI